MDEHEWLAQQFEANRSHLRLSLLDIGGGVPKLIL